MAFLLRAVAAPYDTLLHQCVVQLLSWHGQTKLVVRCYGVDPGLGQLLWSTAQPGREWLVLRQLRVGPLGRKSAPAAVEVPGAGLGYGPQQWVTSGYSTEAEWRHAWAGLVGWGKRPKADERTLVKELGKITP